jgi:hypothetical protein
MIALAGNARQINDASFSYARRQGRFDVIRGSNGYCGGDYPCPGPRGYGTPTGWGRPQGTAAL